MRRLTWVCDKCGFEQECAKDEDDLCFLVSDSMNGWVTLTAYRENEEKDIDLCPTCAKEVLGDG